MRNRVFAAMVMAALWPAIKILEAWAGYAERQDQKRGHP